MKSSKPISESTGRHLNFRTQRNTIRLPCFPCGKTDCCFKGPGLSGRAGRPMWDVPGPPPLPPHPFIPILEPPGWGCGSSSASARLCVCARARAHTHTHTHTHTQSSSTPGITGLLSPCTSDEIQSLSMTDKAPGSEQTSGSTHFFTPLPHSVLLAFALDVLSSWNSFPLAKDICILWDSAYIPIPPGSSP